MDLEMLPSPSEPIVHNNVSHKPDTSPTSMPKDLLRNDSNFLLNKRNTMAMNKTVKSAKSLKAAKPNGFYE